MDRIKEKYVLEIAKSDEIISEALNRIAKADKLANAIKYAGTGRDKTLIDYLQIGLVKGVEIMERENAIKMNRVPNSQYFDRIQSELQSYNVIEEYENSIKIKNDMKKQH